MQVFWTNFVFPHYWLSKEVFMTKRKKARIQKGKFYATFHTGGRGHPSLVFRKNKKKNKYWILVFDTTPRDDRKLLSNPIESTVKHSYLQKRPVIASHGDLGDHELNGLSISKTDKPIIEIVKRKTPLLTRKYKKYLEQKGNKNKKPRKA